MTLKFLTFTHERGSIVQTTEVTRASRAVVHIAPAVLAVVHGEAGLQDYSISDFRGRLTSKQRTKLFTSGNLDNKSLTAGLA
jgi:hypothetical protein